MALAHIRLSGEPQTVQRDGYGRQLVVNIGPGMVHWRQGDKHGKLKEGQSVQVESNVILHAEDREQPNVRVERVVASEAGAKFGERERDMLQFAYDVAKRLNG